MMQSSEITKQQLKSLETEERKSIVEEINYFQQRGKARKPKPAKPATSKSKGNTRDSKDESERSAPRTNCKYCGNQLHRKRRECPACGQVCHKCNKSNHFASVCNAKRPNQLNCVADEQDSDSDFSVLQVETVSTLAGNGKQVLTRLTFCIEDASRSKYKSSMVCQLDTGASCNVISHRDLTVLLQNGSPPLHQSSVKLKMYDGSVMKPLGETCLTAERRGKYHSLKFQVVNTPNKPLLSAESCEMMGLLQFDVDPPQSVHVVESIVKTLLTKETILTAYKDVFEGLGHIGDSTFMVNETVKPVQHAPRRVPVALREEVKKKLTDLEKRGIIKKVTEPTEWISSMVIGAKPNKSRICLDPRELNKALKRPKYQMPTLEEILPRLAKAKVFSTLDTKDGFLVRLVWTRKAA